MIGAWRDSVAGRRWFIALAALALWVQVLVPQGYMVSPDQAAPGLVICTGHGAFTLPGHEHPGKAPKSSPDTPCAFAAHGGLAGPPTPIRVAGAPLKPELAIIAPLYDVAPGRGLVAPPPPSQAPPSPLI
jgi:hypothetical protein